MERVLCQHGMPCNLMTNSFGDSYYVCREPRRKDRCSFKEKSLIKLVDIEGRCIVHGVPIKLRNIYKDCDGAEKVKYVCVRADRGAWCGHYFFPNKIPQDDVPSPKSLTDKQEGLSQDNSSAEVIGGSDNLDRPSWRVSRKEDSDRETEGEEESVSNEIEDEKEEQEEVQGDEEEEEKQEEVQGDEEEEQEEVQRDEEEEEMQGDEEEEEQGDEEEEEQVEDEEEQDDREADEQSSVAESDESSIIRDSLLLVNTEVASSDYSDQEKENKAPVHDVLPSQSPLSSNVGELTDKLSDMGLHGSDSSTNREVATVEETDSAVVVEEVDDDEEEEDDDRGSGVFKPGRTYRKLCRQLLNTRQLYAQLSGKLHDGGAKLVEREQLISLRMKKLRGRVPTTTELVAILESYAKEKKEGDEVKQKVPVKKQLLDTQLTRMLTSGVVKHLHTSLASCPSETDLADTPAALTVSLLQHQRRALKWMWWREEQVPSGGILADDMGLGKTLSTISLLVVKKQEDRQTVRKVQDLNSINATLIVVPASLMHMWEAEMKSKVKAGVLRVKIYHGSSRAKDPSELMHYNVVITTYNIVGIEGSSVLENVDPRKKKRASTSTALFQLHWKRIVLDEGHTVRNPKSNLSLGCSGLSADHRWVLTGTPVQNKLEDFYSLIRFLRLAPFDNNAVWKRMIGSGSRQGMQRLQAMVATLVLRRTKEEQGLAGISHLKLPAKVIVTHQVELTPKEKVIYDVLFSQGRAVFTKYLENKGELATEKEPSHSLQQQLENVSPSVASGLQKLMDPASKGYTGILVLLLRLRQCCSHLGLLRPGMTSASSGVGDYDETGLEAAMEGLTLDAAPCVDLPREFSDDSPSAKVTLMLAKLKEIIACDNKDGPPYKCIVVSQWTSMLRVVAGHLNANRITHISIDGTIPPAMRQSIVDRFNSARPDPRVMLLSLQAGGVGLNLIGANHVIMLDLHWNPQLEVQASDRCHRVGQTRDVTVHRFVTKDTIESAILLLQERKLKLADDVLSGARSHKGSRFQLTLHDLKELFEM